MFLCGSRSCFFQTGQVHIKTGMHYWKSRQSFRDRDQQRFSTSRCSSPTDGFLLSATIMLAKKIKQNKSCCLRSPLVFFSILYINFLRVMATMHVTIIRRYLVGSESELNLTFILRASNRYPSVTYVNNRPKLMGFCSRYDNMTK